MMGEEERLEMMNHHNHHDEQQHHSFQGKMRLENWEEQVLSHQQASMVAVDIKQESSINNNNGYVISSPNSPPNKSCVTTTTTSLNSNDDNNNNNNNMLDFSSNHNGLHLSEGRHTPPDRSSEVTLLPHISLILIKYKRKKKTTFNIMLYSERKFGKKF